MAQYLQVTNVSIPVAAPGTTVRVAMTVKNLYTGTIRACVNGGVTPNGAATQTFQSGYADISPGGSRIFQEDLVTPSQNSTLFVTPWWLGGDGKYHGDETVLKSWNISELTTISIIGVTAPTSASYGSTVNVSVVVKNNSSSARTVGVMYNYDGRTLEMSPSSASVTAGASKTFTAQFMMPNLDVILVLAACYVDPGTGGWVLGETTSRDISLTTAEPPPGEPLTGLKNTSVDVVLDTYDFGAAVPYVLGYDYRGKAQSGTLKVELGTGVYPTFSPKAVIGPVSYAFGRKDEYTRVTESRTFVLPSTLVRGQTYSVRATLTTSDGITDNDIDYTALRVLDTTVPSTDLQALAITTQYRDYALGENLPCSISFKYKGIAQGGTIQAFIKKGLALVYTYPPVTMQFERADTLTTITREVSLGLPRTLEPGQVYSLRIEIVTSDGKDTSETKGSAFRIAADEVPTDPGVGEYRLVKDYMYPYGEGYRGNASEATAEFTVAIAQLPGTDWISQQVINSFESAVTEHGSHMLQLVIYERDEGLLSKGYKVIAIATQPAGVAGQEYTPQGITDLAYVSPQLGPAIWALIIIAALALVAIVVSMLSPTVRNVVWGEGGVVDVITDIGSLLGDVIPMMVLAMMLMLVMEQTREIYEPKGAPPRPKPITEAAVKAARWAGREAVELAEKGWGEAKKLVAEARKEWTEAHEADKERKAEELRQAEERARESREKLREAKAELRKRREEQAKRGEQQT